MLEPLADAPAAPSALALWEHAPRALGELADELAMEPATLSPIVKRLEGQGLVTRARSAADERVLEIALTTEGAELRTLALAVPEQIMARVGMDATELAARDGLACSPAGEAAERVGRRPAGAAADPRPVPASAGDPLPGTVRRESVEHAGRDLVVPTTTPGASVATPAEARRPPASSTAPIAFPCRREISSTRRTTRASSDG